MIDRKALTAILLAGTALYAVPALGQPQPQPQMVAAAEDVVITANFLPTPIAEVASSVTVVTAREIELKQLRSLPDVLKDIPGLNVVQTGGPGGQTSVFLRGTNSGHTKVILDGIEINDPSSPNGAFDYSHMLTGNIDRVEVLRGPQSGLYGSDAIGGVINIITKKGMGPLQVTGSVEGGSFDTLNENLGASGSQGMFNYAFSAEHVHVGDMPVTPKSLLPPGQAAIGNYYDNYSLFTRLGADISQNFDVGFVGRYTYTKLRFTSDDFPPPTFGAVPRAVQSVEDSQQYDTRGTAHFIVAGVDNTIGGAYSSSIRTDVDNPSGTHTIYYGSRYKFDYLGSVRVLDGQDLTFGASTLEEKNSSYGAFPVAARDNQQAVYGQLQSDFGNNVFNTASLRFDHHSRFGDAVTYRIAPAVLVPDMGLKLKGSAGTGFKAPTLDQLYHDYPAFFFFANPNLKPEKSFGYDIGFEETVLNDQVMFGATYFHNDITDLIDTDPVTFSTVINVGKASTYGLEAFAAYQMMETLSFRADYTYTEAMNDLTHVSLVRRPKNKISGTVIWEPMDGFTLTGTVLHTGVSIDGDRVFFSRTKTKPWTTVDVAAAFDVTPNVNIYGRITNLFDEKYEVPLGFRAPGRGFIVGIKGTM
jgi:vitamin B12 transporter